MRPSSGSLSRILGLKAEVQVLFVYNWYHESSIIQSSGVGCLIFRGCLSIEVNGRTVGTFWNYPWMFAVEECPFSGVPLYQKYISPLISILPLSTRLVT